MATYSAKTGGHLLAKLDMGLLVERVDFDGQRQTVAITFRPTGIRTLAAEVAAAQGAP